MNNIILFFKSSISFLAEILITIGLVSSPITTTTPLIITATTTPEQNTEIVIEIPETIIESTTPIVEPISTTTEPTSTTTPLTYTLSNGVIVDKDGNVLFVPESAISTTTFQGVQTPLQENDIVIVVEVNDPPPPVISLEKRLEVNIICGGLTEDCSTDTLTLPASGNLHLFSFEVKMKQGEEFLDSQMITFTTPDESQNKSSILAGNKIEPHTFFHYFPKTPGIHHLTITSGDVKMEYNIMATAFTKSIPKVELVVGEDTVLEKDLLDQPIGEIKITNIVDQDYIVNGLKYEIISDDFELNDVPLYFKNKSSLIGNNSHGFVSFSATDLRSHGYGGNKKDMQLRINAKSFTKTGSFTLRITEIQLTGVTSGNWEILDGLDIDIPVVVQ